MSRKITAELCQIKDYYGNPSLSFNEALSVARKSVNACEIYIDVLTKYNRLVSHRNSEMPETEWLQRVLLCEATRIAELFGQSYSDVFAITAAEAFVAVSILLNQFDTWRKDDKIYSSWFLANRSKLRNIWKSYEDFRKDVQTTLQVFSRWANKAYYPVLWAMKRPKSVNSTAERWIKKTLADKNFDYKSYSEVMARWTIQDRILGMYVFGSETKGAENYYNAQKYGPLSPDVTPIQAVMRQSFINIILLDLIHYYCALCRSETDNDRAYHSRQIIALTYALKGYISIYAKTVAKFGNNAFNIPLDLVSMGGVSEELYNAVMWLLLQIEIALI